MQQANLDEEQKAQLFKSINYADYEEGSSSQILVQFTKNNYELTGSFIDGAAIKGSFGHGELQQPRNQRLVMLVDNQSKLIEKVSKIIITKSTFKKKQNLKLKFDPDSDKRFSKNNDFENEKSGQNKQENEQNIDAEEFFSQSSQSNDNQERQISSVRRIYKKNQKIQKSRQNKKAGLSKNILKKKLKFLCGGR